MKWYVPLDMISMNLFGQCSHYFCVAIQRRFEYEVGCHVRYRMHVYVRVEYSPNAECEHVYQNEFH